MKNFYLILALIFAVSSIAQCQASAHDTQMKCGLLRINGDGNQQLPSYGPEKSLFPQHRAAEILGNQSGLNVPIPEPRTTFEFVQMIVLFLIGAMIRKREQQRNREFENVIRPKPRTRGR